MGDPARNTPPPTDAERAEHYARQLRAAGVPDGADLTAETDATTDEVCAWLEGKAPCPWPR